MTRDTEVKFTEGQNEQLGEVSIYRKTTGTCAIYVHLCNGEVRVIPDANAVSLDQDLLCVCGNNCQPRQYFPRKDVYFCTRVCDAPVPPPC